MDSTTLILILLVAVVFLVSQRFTGAEARSRKLRNARKKILELKADIRNESNPVKKKSIDAEIIFLEKFVEDLTIELGFSNGDEYSIKESLKLAKAEFEKAREVLNDFEKIEKDERERLAKEHTEREKELLSKARLLEKQELEERKRAARATKEFARKKAREDRELARKDAALMRKDTIEENVDQAVVKKGFFSIFKKSKVDKPVIFKPEIDGKKTAKENRKLARERREEELRVRKELKEKQRAERKAKGVNTLESSDKVFESENLVEKEVKDTASLAYSVSDTSSAADTKSDHFLEFNEEGNPDEKFTTFVPVDLYSPVNKKSDISFTHNENLEKSDDDFPSNSEELIEVPKKKKSLFSSLFSKKEYAVVSDKSLEVSEEIKVKKRKGIFGKKEKVVIEAVNSKWSIDDVDLNSSEGGSIVSIDESTLESNVNEISSEQAVLLDTTISLNDFDDVSLDNSTAFTEAHLESSAINAVEIVEDITDSRSFYEEVIESNSEGESIGMDRTLIELSDEELSSMQSSSDASNVKFDDLNSYDDTSVKNKDLQIGKDNAADLRDREDKDERKRLKEEEKQARLEAKRAELDAKKLERELKEKSKQEESILVAQAKIAERARIQEERLAEERAKAAAKAAMELIKNEERLEKAKANAAAREAKRLARREKFNKKFEDKKAKALEKAKIEEIKKAERIANAQKKIDDKKIELALKEKERAEKAEIKRLSHAAKVEAKRAQAQLNREEAENRAADRADAERRRNEERKLRRLTAVKRSEELEQRRIQRKAEKFGLVSTAIERKPVEKVGYTWDTESGYSYELSDAKRNAGSAFEFKKYDLPEDLPRG